MATNQQKLAPEIYRIFDAARDLLSTKCQGYTYTVPELFDALGYSSYWQTLSHAEHCRIGRAWAEYNKANCISTPIGKRNGCIEYSIQA